jgi:hypothetical protein
LCLWQHWAFGGAAALQSLLGGEPPRAFLAGARVVAGCYSLVVVVQQSPGRPYAAELGRRSLRGTAQRESRASGGRSCSA